VPSIDQILTDVLRREGWPKVTDHPSDRGGLTKGGVTFKNYNAWLVKRHGVSISEQAFRDLTESEARSFFYDQFFAPFEFVRQASHALYVLLGDWAVNSGPDDPTKALQAELHVQVDGAIGNETRGAFKAIEDSSSALNKIRRAIVRRRQDFYIDAAFDSAVRKFLEEHKSSQLHNLRGWLRRNLEFAT
jgi:lysozyme family protein